MDLRSGQRGYTYLLEILTGLVGSRRRWRTAPWLVLLFYAMFLRAHLCRAARHVRIVIRCAPMHR